MSYTNQTACEALANADAHLNNVAMPTYSYVLEALRQIQLIAVSDETDYTKRCRMDDVARNVRLMALDILNAE